jgi:hypothetical protein
MVEHTAPPSDAVRPTELSAEQADATIRSKQYAALLCRV